VLDDIDTESDRRVADHVLGSHKYRRPGQDMAPEPLDTDLHRNFDAVLGDDAVHVGHDSAELGETPPVPDEDEKSSIWRAHSVGSIFRLMRLHQWFESGSIFRSCLSQCGGNDACLRRPGPDFLEPKIKIPGRWKIRITIG